MHSATILSAILAFGAAVVSAADCKNIKITEPNPSIACTTIDGDVTVDDEVAGDLVIEGVKRIKGDFIVKGASGLVSISSSSLTAIDGKFELQNLVVLSKLDLPELKSVDQISLVKLPQLDSLNFGQTGVTKISSVRITDTFISDLSGFSVATVENLEIDNNRKMTSFDSDLVNITGRLIINNNGNNMEITMNMLELASEIQLSNIKAFEAPLLSEVSESIKFDKNPELKSFNAPNLTTVTKDVSFINNKKLTKIAMPKLESVSGLTIQNNTALKSVDGFPKLAKVSGAIILRGSFTKVQLPKLEDVKGSVTVTSTTDISGFCNFFDELNEGGAIQGEYSCTSNNKVANEGGNEGESTRSDGSSSSEEEEDAAGILSVNMAVLGLAGVAALAQLL